MCWPSNRGPLSLRAITSRLSMRLAVTASLPPSDWTGLKRSQSSETYLTALGKLLLQSGFMWRRRKSTERPPWYRARGYKGKLTEAEKRELDAFRARPRHPAFEHGDLPEHVEMYISGLEVEADELKQERATCRAIVFSLGGAVLLYANHFGFAPRNSEPDPKVCSAGSLRVIYRLRDGSEALIRDVDASA